MVDRADLQLRFNLPDFDESDADERRISPVDAQLISETARRHFEKRGNWAEVTDDEKAPAWVHDYNYLRGQGWPWRVAGYIAWAASPKINRWPKTVNDLAVEVLGLTSPRVIYTWRDKYPGINAVVELMQLAPLFEHRRDVLDALVEMARFFKRTLK